MLIARCLPLFATVVFLAACEPAPSTPKAPPIEPSPIAAPAPPIARRSQPIYKIDAITLARVPNQAPEHLVIKVRGTVKSGGWTNPILKPAPVPRGGPATRAFVFEATPPGPDAFVTQALTPIEAGLTVTDLSPETRTIVIHCETAAVSQELP